MFWIKLKIQNSFSNYIKKKKTEKILEEVKNTSKVNIIAAILFKLLVLLTFGFIILIPFYIMIVLSISPDDQANDVYPVIIPNSINFSAFSRAIQEDYWKSLGWTFLITVISVIVKIFFSSTFGYAFSIRKWRFKKLTWLFFLSVLILPEVALLIGQYRTIIILQWEKEPTFLALALMMPFAASVFSGYMYRNAFEAIPDRIKEASMVDGCSGIKYFFKIALPMVSPTTWTVGILTAFAAWNSFLWPLLLLGKDSSIKLINIYLLDVGINPDNDSPIQVFKNVKMAGAIMAILPMFIAYFLFRKRILNAISRQGSTIKG
ncbi:carbohydrate ABC transporter permease [[Mycoplasma] collis]|uniref:carbohydrate ABC transporter permease n=1 Tax=[Mycoplasma] collis TaxID=2127 RepID=UPI00051AFE8F|nr:carbohydrate ABC transporter permease [[Mycoplasma] collis]